MDLVAGMRLRLSATVSKKVQLVERNGHHFPLIAREKLGSESREASCSRSLLLRGLDRFGKAEVLMWLFNRCTVARTSRAFLLDTELLKRS